jgi:mycothiol synthase
MAALLPVARHADVQTRAFDPARDEEAWLAVNNRAFAGHSEQGGWTLATLRRREAEEWFDPEGFRLHEREGRLAAFCWTKVHPSDPDFDGEPVGEIYVIAVDPDFHGHGLGSQLTLAGLDHLAGRGLRHAILYVDAGNEVAVTMYERLGFAIASTSIATRRQVAG